jgi:23S rRNA (uracil1939-C5)-methyltransferase
LSIVSASTSEAWQQGQLLECQIDDLTDGGDGVGCWHQRVVFVPDTVPGDRILVRLIRVKPNYAWGKLQQVLVASPHRIRPACIVADKCGGCQWQHIDYSYQLVAKQNLVVQALERIGGITNPPVATVLPAHEALHYRNKATYPLRRSPMGQVQAGYYQKGSHQLINLNQCPIQDQRLDPFLAGIKHDLQQRGWSLYDEHQHQGELRHLALRVGRRTGECLLTIVACQGNLPGLIEQAQQWLEHYPQLIGVALNLNPNRGNQIFGTQTQVIAGQGCLREEFAGLQFHIQPTTFFQVFTEQAEAVLQLITQHLDLQGHEILCDAYCGIGALTLPLAQFVQRAIGLEIDTESVMQAQQNAQLNQIANVTFQAGAVETILPSLSLKPDVVLLDPPRKGCDRAVLETLQVLKPTQIVYISCNPATLARDLKVLMTSEQYQLTTVQPADFFPQTSHVEAVAFLASTVGSVGVQSS